MAMPSTLPAVEWSRDLECPVCQEHYKDPRILPCGHTLCLKPCLEHIAGDKLNFKCPECRTEHDVPTTGIGGFLKNVAISRMLTVRPKEKYDKPNVNVCPICEEDDELRKCRHCQIYVCYGCLTEHTPQYKQTLKDRAHQILVRHEKASSDLKASAQDISQSVNQKADESISQINTAASSAVVLIEDKAKELKAAVESARQEELEQVAEMSEELESSLKSAVGYSKGILKDLEKKNMSLVKLDRISTKLSENEITLNEDLMSLVTQKSIDIDLNISGLETAMKDIVVIRRTYLNQKEVDVETGSAQSLSDEQSTEASADVSSLLDKDISQIKMVFDSDNPNRLRPSRPQAVAIDPSNGDVVLTDTGNHRVERYDSAGKLIRCFGTQGSGSDQFSSPRGVVVNNQSQVIICDTGNHRIKIHNKDGSYCRTIGSNGSKVGELSSPCDLALDGGNNIHVCDKYNGRIQVFTRDGTSLFQYQPAGCTRPECICISSGDNICVSERNTCITLNAYFQCISEWTIPDRISNNKAKGKFVFAKPQHSDSVSGMCVYDDDYIMLSSSSGKIMVYDFDGERLKEFEIKNIPQFRELRGMTIDEHGDIYVACQDVVLKF